MENIQKLMKESPAARWTALVLVAITMFAAYFFVDVLSPLEKLVEIKYKWDPTNYGIFASSEYFLNVFVFFLIISGIILDKMGVRFTGLTAAITMLIGASIKYYGLSESFNSGGFGYDFMNSFWTSLMPSAKVAALGFAIFGIGVEMAGITVSKSIVKWFKGKEMAMAMGVEMAIARLAVFGVFRISPWMAGESDVLKPVYFGLLLLTIGFLTFLVYTFMDRKLDKQIGDQNENSDDEEFRISDLKFIITNPGFWVIAILCVLFYSAVFPFQKYAVNMLENRLSMSTKEASDLFSYLPIGAGALTPFLGLLLDKRGKGATMMIYGALLLIITHLIFALVPADSFSYAIAIIAIIILGIAFSLVPASMWPSVPKIVDERYLGSAYALIFWIQNIGLWLIPIVIGVALNAANPGISERLQAGDTTALYNYTVPMLIFASLGVLAVIFGFILKALDKKKGYGLELPNKK